MLSRTALRIIVRNAPRSRVHNRAYSSVETTGGDYVAQQAAVKAHANGTTLIQEHLGGS